MHTTFAIESNDSPAPGIIPEPVRMHDQAAGLLRIGLTPSEQADRALLRRTTTSIVQLLEGPKAVARLSRDRSGTRPSRRS